MHPSRRVSGSYPRPAARVTAVAFAIATLLVMAWARPATAGLRPAAPRPSGGSPSLQPSHRGWVKYYIVQSPTDGKKEFLYEIAAKTLGNGSRAAEIFALNKGRLQPGGGRLVNPTVILPGWILVLPLTASGPGVHYGPLPAVTPSPGRPGTAGPTTGALPPTSGHHRAGDAAARSARIRREAEVGGAVLIALLIGAGLLIMRRRRRGAAGGRSAPADGDSRALGGRAARPASPDLRAPPPRAAILASGPAGAGRDRDSPALIPPAVDGSPSVAQPPGPIAALGPAATAGYPAWLDGPVAEPREFTQPPVGPADSATPGPPASPGPATGTDAALRPVLPPGTGLPGVLDGAGEPPWPDFLTPTGPRSTAAIAPSSARAPVAGSPAPGPVPSSPGSTDAPGAGIPGPDVCAAPISEPVPAMDAAGVVDTTAMPGPGAGDAAGVLASGGTGAAHDGTRVRAAESPDRAFSPVALRVLGAQRSFAQRAESPDVPTQRHQLALGDDRIDVMLAEAPAVSSDGRPRSGHTWLTATPYLVWTPLPYDAPDDGIAFACLGAGDEGCLFVDLAAAPGAVAIGGDSGAAARLAESIAHQLCLAAESGRPCIAVVVGSALPEPHPPGAAWVASIGDLASAATPGPEDGTEIVFCAPRSDKDAFALARYVGSAQRRVVPVVLADLPGAPWSFTAEPSLRPAAGLHSAIS